ncbi:MAG: hypothetical protein U5J63_13180 [Fodinibius sp.]|nr:hypothetical protein [Fodinibius sp.]
MKLSHATTTNTIRNLSQAVSQSILRLATTLIKLDEDEQAL